MRPVLASPPAHGTAAGAIAGTQPAEGPGCRGAGLVLWGPRAAPHHPGTDTATAGDGAVPARGDRGSTGEAAGCRHQRRGRD